MFVKTIAKTDISRMNETGYQPSLVICREERVTLPLDEIEIRRLFWLVR